jgi:transcriptional regulator with XRE-family HTH domain
MGSVETDMTMTTAQRFAAWLAPAMRRAGLNIDSLRGGGRTEFANAVGVSPSTVNRWLGGTSAPEPDKYEQIATALNVDPIAMLVDVGIISSQTANERRKSAIDSPAITPGQAADGLGIHDPLQRQMFKVFLDGLTRAPVTPSDQDGDGGAAVER